MGNKISERKVVNLPLSTIKTPTISVVIPAKNEADNIPHVAARMPAGIDEIVVVDGDSVDNTVEVARRTWPDALIVRQTRKGKGNALACGFEAATGDIIVMIDADCSTDPAEIPRFVGALVTGADFAKGSRFIQGGGSTDITHMRRFGNFVLNFIVNVLFGTRYSDLCYGYNAFWRDSMSVFKLPSTQAAASQWGDGFEIETLINVRVAAAGLDIAEVGSYEQDRLHGVSNLNAFSDGLRVLRTIFAEWRSHRKVRRHRHAHDLLQAGGTVDLHSVATAPQTQLLSMITPDHIDGPAFGGTDKAV
jgi:glycosyltransferase involved in cell wall biosynthesis